MKSKPHAQQGVDFECNPCERGPAASLRAALTNYFGRPSGWHCCVRSHLPECSALNGVSAAVLAAHPGASMATKVQSNNCAHLAPTWQPRSEASIAAGFGRHALVQLLV